MRSVQVKKSVLNLVNGLNAVSLRLEYLREFENLIRKGRYSSALVLANNLHNAFNISDDDYISLRFIFENANKY